MSTALKRAKRTGVEDLAHNLWVHTDNTEDLSLVHTHAKIYISPRGDYRSRPSPMQMLTQPSAPDIQAPNQANSASGGVITP